MTHITDLPREVGRNILTFLPTDEAVQTSFLLMRGEWEIRMTDLSRLKFLFTLDQGGEDDEGEDGEDDEGEDGGAEDDEGEDGEGEDGDGEDGGAESRFVRFVDRVLTNRGNRKVLKFSLTLEQAVDSDPISRWIDYCLVNRVEKMKLQINEVRGGAYELPRGIFVQNTLVHLKLGGAHESLIIDGDDDGDGDVNLPLLKTLYLDSIWFSSAWFSKLMSSCPKIEELVMIDIKWQRWDHCILQSASLRKLKMRWDDMDDLDRVAQNVSFHTPNLTHLEYQDYVAGLYPIVRFDSLEEAKIDLRTVTDEDEVEYEDGGSEFNAADFFAGISGVRKLRLTSRTIQALQTNCHPTPVLLDNLIHLQLDIVNEEDSGWEALLSCPNLETLTTLSA